MRRTRLALAAAGLLACAAPASASVALPDARVSPSARWPQRQLVVALPTRRVLADADVTVRENGVRVPGVRVTSEAQNTGRGVILAIDTSLTMRGEPIRQAMTAARSFARRRAPHTPLGVLYFSGASRLALAPTTDARKIAATLAVGPQTSRGTRIYDAVAAGIRALQAGRLTSGVVIVLSDGAEAIKGSAITAPQLTAAARRADVRIFSVGLDSRSFDSSALRLMASGTGGRYGEAARPRDLPPIFGAIGERLSKEYLVAYRSPMPAGRAVAVTVDVAGETSSATTSYQTPKLSLSAAGPGRAERASGLSSARIGLLAGLAFAVMTLALYLALRPRRRSLITRIGDFAGRSPDDGVRLEDVRVRRARKRRASDQWQRLAEAVELSGVRVGPTALIAGTAVMTASVAWWAVVAAGRPALAVLALVVPVGAHGYVAKRLAARRREFEEQLPDNLQVLASALRAGFSFSAALNTMADEAPEPSRTEMRRAATDEQLGVDISECLRGVAERMHSPEVEYVGIVAQMQRDSGGNTAEVLEHVLRTIRERLQLRRMVRTLTAQGRLGGAVISAVPIFLAVGMSALHPGYFDPMFGSPVGVLLFLAAAVLLGIGWLAIRKIVDVEP